MSVMHPETLALLQARIRAEVQADPSERGYAGKSAGQIAALMNAPIAVVAAAAYRDVLVSDVEGYLEGQLAMQRLIDWIENNQGDSQALTIAKTLRRVMSDGRLSRFLTADPAKRANVLGMFHVLAQTEGTGITQAHADALAAMTIVHEITTEAPPRWSSVIEGIGGVGGEPGPPNAADEALIAGALA